MKQFLILVLGVFIFNFSATSQCPNNGQNPSSAFPVCAATTFTQSTVPQCDGRAVPVPPCTTITYTDINPYYYKFTAFQVQPLVFTIVPITNSDDYDWQLFDVTGKNPNNIYTDATMFVCCNWSGNTGTTGTSLTATSSNSCEGSTPNINKAPILKQAHDYILLISHFTNTGQSGYNLSFSNASGMVDTTAPAVKNITANCVANKVLIKLNKKMKCNTITADGSDISITSNPVIATMDGYGCNTNFDTDSIIVSLANPLPSGNYTAQIKTGTDGNTILDNCGNGIPENVPFDFVVVGAAQPTPMDSIKTLLCQPNTLELVFKAPLKCSSITPNASEFVLTGPSIVAITSATVNCINGLSTTITLNFATPIIVGGNYTLTLKNGEDGNTLLNQCDVATLAGSSITFPVYVKPTPNFTYTIKSETCKADTLIYNHNGNNSANKWQWNFDGTPTTSSLQTQQVVYNSFITRQVKLVVSNPACIDSITQNIAIIDHLLIPKFIAARDTTCPNNPLLFTDSSKGNITSWKWDFANTQTSVSPTPATQLYPVLPVNKIYLTKLIVTNQIGCVDSITKNIFVRGTIPTVFDSIIAPSCAATEVKIYFKQAMICSSVSLDGSEFTINGAAPNTVLGASINCINGVGTTVTLQLAQPLITGNYSITLKTGTDGNTIINDCGIETLIATVFFKAFGHIDTTFTYTTKLGCTADTVTYHHNSNNGVNQWQWIFDGNPTISNLQTPTVIYNNFNIRDVQLIVSNGACFDTTKKAIAIVNHFIKAKFAMPDTTCGFAGTIFTDSSQGIITGWNWRFGDGQTSIAKNPINNYPLSYIYKNFEVQLIAKNIVGCIDTAASKTIVVKPSAAATMDKMDYNICSPDSFIIYFNAPMLCNTVAANGSDFAITGASNPTIASASIINCTNGFGKAVVVKLLTPITVGGYYKINLVKGTDGNTILNDCGVETAASFLGFVAHNNVDASFTSINKIDCKEDTLFLNHTVANEENKFTWFVNGSYSSASSNLILPYKDSSVKSITLITANPTCKDTSSQIFTLVFNKIKAKIAVNNNVICPFEAVIFKDTSYGKVVSWNWNFDNNGSFSTDKYPTPQVYDVPQYSSPINNSTDIAYSKKIVLIVGNDIPCYDTTYQTIKITPNCLIEVPTAFTPNSDGLNDYLYPLNAYKAIKLNFRVYNRLGRLIFESSNNGEKWNGNNYQKVKQPAGTYVWTLNYTDKDTGKEIFLKGTSVLIR